MTPDDVAHFEITKDRDEVARRVLTTYAALEAVKAENARLGVEIQTRDEMMTDMANKAVILRAQPTEAQKDSARLDSLERCLPRTCELWGDSPMSVREAIDAAVNEMANAAVAESTASGLDAMFPSVARLDALTIRRDAARSGRKEADND